MINLTLNHLSYNDDEEYRAILCDVFNIPDFESAAAESFEFDAHFKDIYEATKMNPFFTEIFMKAAGFMFSQDPLTGICILCSYDYLALFYDAFVAYHTVSNDPAFRKDSLAPAFGKDTHVCAMALWQRIMT